MQKLLNEAQIRQSLLAHVKRKVWKRSDVAIPEYFVDKAARRVDLVVASDRICAYEIKSDLDDLTRLVGQLEVYSRCFEEVTVVCTPRHLPTVLSIVSGDIGVMCIAEAELTEIQLPKRKIIGDVDVWFGHLPLAVIRSALSSRGYACPRTERRAILDVARRHLSLEDVRAEVLKYLKGPKRKQRTTLRNEKRLVPTLDPLVEHRRMLRDYLESRGITDVQMSSSKSSVASIRSE